MAVEQAFHAQTQQREDPTATKDLDIYVDGSLSMRGFVTAGSNYTRIVRDVVESSTAAGFNLTAYKFSTDVSQITQLPLVRLQSPEFYDGLDTPLADLLQRLNKAHSVIIITDMVQSARGTDNLDLAKAFAAVGTRRPQPQMKLLAYRSDFSGLYYPESVHSRFKLQASQSIPESGRPFYMLVIAPNSASMKLIDEYILSHNPPSQSFDATGAPVVIDAIQLYSDGDAPAWSLHSKSQIEQFSSFRRVESSYRLKSSSGRHGDTIALPLEFKIEPGSLIREPGKLELECYRSTWNGAKHSEPATAIIQVSGEFYTPQFRAVAQPAASGHAAGGIQSMRLRLEVPPPERRSWDVYLIKMKPGQANLKLPDWVAEWSTEDDSVPRNGNRTFQLRLLVESMMDAISEHVMFGEYFLRLGGE